MEIEEKSLSEMFPTLCNLKLLLTHIDYRREIFYSRPTAEEFHRFLAILNSLGIYEHLYNFSKHLLCSYEEYKNFLFNILGIVRGYFKLPVEYPPLGVCVSFGLAKWIHLKYDERLTIILGCWTRCKDENMLPSHIFIRPYTIRYGFVDLLWFKYKFTEDEVVFASRLPFIVLAYPGMTYEVKFMPETNIRVYPIGITFMKGEKFEE